MTYHRFVTGVPGRVPHVQRELPTLPEHLSSPPVLVGLCCSIFSWLCRAYRLYCKTKYVTKSISLGYL